MCGDYRCKDVEGVGVHGCGSTCEVIVSEFGVKKTNNYYHPIFNIMRVT